MSNTDLISRADALAVARYSKDPVEGIENLPSVESVVHGRPVKIFNDPWTGRLFTTCSVCNGKISPKDDFCKHCGAKMDEEVG